MVEDQVEDLYLLRRMYEFGLCSEGLLCLCVPQLQFHPKSSIVFSQWNLEVEFHIIYNDKQIIEILSSCSTIKSVSILLSTITKFVSNADN